MKRLFNLLLLLTLSTFTSFGTTYVTKNDGNYSSNSTWVGNQSPLNINSGDLVIINHNINSSNVIDVKGTMRINSNSKLEQSKKINVDGTIIVEQNGTLLNKSDFNINGSGKLYLYGTMIIDGKFNNDGITELDSNSSIILNDSPAHLSNKGIININTNSSIIFSFDAKLDNDGTLNINGIINISNSGNSSSFKNQGNINGIGIIDLGGITTSKITSGTINGSTSTNLSQNINNLGNNNITPTNIWIGTNGGSWNISNNWSTNNIPTSYETILIPSNTSPKLSNNINVGSVQVNGYIDLNGYNLKINGRVWGSGSIKGKPTSTIVLDGNRTIVDTINITDTIGSIYILRKIKFIDTVRISNLLNLSDTLYSYGNVKLIPLSTTSYGQIIGNYPIIGEITYCKKLSNTNDGWRDISLPLIGNFNTFNGILIKDSTNTNNENEINIYYWDATKKVGNDTAKGWTTGTLSSNNDKAYSIYGSNNTDGFHTVNENICHTGTYTYSNKTYNIINSYDPDGSGTLSKGWNNIPNPYPSNISINDLFSDNINISYKAIHVWDAINSRYVAICSTGVSIQNYNTYDTVNYSKIQPFQSFWVKTDSSMFYNVNSSIRTTNNSNVGIFMKNKRSILRINAKFNDNNSYDQAVIYRDELGDMNNINLELDAYKLKPESNSIYFNYSEPISIKSIYYNDFKIPFRVSGKCKISANLIEFDNNIVYLVSNTDTIELSEDWIEIENDDYFLISKKINTNIYPTVEEYYIIKYEAYTIQGVYIGEFYSYPNIDDIFILKTHLSNGKIITSKNKIIK